jgi:hypothetical protein
MLAANDTQVKLCLMRLAKNHILSTTLFTLVFILFNFMSSSSFATDQNCSMGGTFSIVENEVRSSSGCSGIALIPSGVTSIAI